MASRLIGYCCRSCGLRWTCGGRLRNGGRKSRLGRGEMRMSPIGGMKARMPPSANRALEGPSLVARRRALQRGMKQEAATASTRCSLLSKCDRITGFKEGLGHIWVTVINNRPLQRDTMSDGRKSLEKLLSGKIKMIGKLEVL